MPLGEPTQPPSFDRPVNQVVNWLRDDVILGGAGGPYSRVYRFLAVTPVQQRLRVSQAFVSRYKRV